MKPIEIPADAQVWTREIDALRALARALIRDEHAVEDALQETWLRARTSAPAVTARPGAWLATVLKNLVRERGRSEARRSAREEARAAETASLPTPEEMAERLELAQRVAAEAAALPEPYLSTIHLHYFEGLTAAEIAARTEQPLETVRTQVRRGLERMRVRLDGSVGGERRAWCLALAPLALPAPGASTSAGPALAWLGGSLVMYKTVSIAAAVLVLAGVSWFALSDSFATASPAVARPSTPLGSLAASGEGERETRAEVAPESARVAAPVEDAPHAPPATLAVAGRVVVVDQGGAEHPDEWGMLDLALEHPDGREEWRELTVEAGRWALEVPSGTVVVPAHLVIDGNPVLLEPGPSGSYSGPDPVEVHAPLELVVRARWTEDVSLHAVDSEGRELSGVEVRRRTSWRAIVATVHPGDAEEVTSVARDAFSPLLLPDPGAGLRVVPHWVRAPGYAWRPIEVDHDAGGERTVILTEAGGALELSALGPVPAGDVFLRLYEPRRAGGSSFHYAAEVSVDAAGRASIEDLAPGTYGARLERGSFHSALILARGTVAVAPGEVAYLDLEIDRALLERRTTHLAGTLRIPAGLDRDGLALVLEVQPSGSVPGQARVRLPLADMTFDAGDPQVLSWSAGEVLPALYLASVSRVMHRELIDARSGETNAAHLVLPPLARVSVGVRAAETAEPPERVRLDWADGQLDGVNSNSWAKVRVDRASGRFVFEAPHGPIEIQVQADGYVTASRTLELTGDLELEVPLERATGVVLSFFEGETRVPIALEVSSLRLLDPTSGDSLHEQLHDMRTDSRERRLFLQPGTYELHFLHWPEEWEPIEKIVAEVPPDGLVEQRVPVRRVQHR